MMVHEIILSGFGGQGVMLMGQLLTQAGLEEGKEVSWIPSYGAAGQPTARSKSPMYSLALLL